MRDFFLQLKGKYDLVGVEVGVKIGDNAQDILKNLDMRRLILVDRWKSYDINVLTTEQKDMKYYDQETIDEWKTIVENKFKDCKNVQIIQGNSTDVAKKMFDSVFNFVYIDASHWYEDVFQDCIAWYRYVKDGWFLGGHDYLHDEFGKDIQKAVQDFAESVRHEVFSKGEDWWIVK